MSRLPPRLLRLARGFAASAAVATLLLFVLQHSGLPLPMPLPGDTERLRPLSALGHLLAAWAVLSVMTRGRMLAAALGVLAVLGLVAYSLAAVKGPLGGWPTPLVSLGFLLVAVGVFAAGSQYRLRQALPAAAGLGLFVMSAGVLVHYADWLASDEHLYLLRTVPTAAVPQLLLALALGALSLDGGNRPWWHRHRPLLVWSGVFAAVLVGAWALTAWSNAQHIRQEAGRRVEGLSKVLLEHFTRSLDPGDLLLQQVVDQVARDGVPDRADAAAVFGKVQPALKALAQVDALLVVDARYRPVFESRPGVVREDARPVIEAAFRTLQAQDDRAIGPVLYDAAGRSTVLYGRRLQGPDGRFAGLVIVGMRGEYYLDFYRSLELGPDASVGVFGRNGEVLLRYPALPSRQPPRLGSDPLFRRLQAQASGVFAAVSPLDGVSRLLGYRTAAQPPVVVVAAIGAGPLADVFQRQFFASVSLLSMALMLLAWAASQQLAAADRERDVQQRLRDAHAEVQASAQHLGEIAATVPGLLYQWFARPDGSRGFRYVSAHAQVLFGLAPERFGRLWWTRIHAEDRPMVRAAIRDAVAARLPWNVEGRVTDGAGQERWVRMMARPTSDGAEVVYTGFVIDITAERHGQAELQRLATTDSLTGLLTRRQFHLLGEREIARHERSGDPMAVLMLDVDHFKRVNDTHGHARGDAVLAAVALAMRDALREVDVLGRFGGEEFVAVLVGADPATASAIAERLRVACGRVAVLVEGGGTLSITVSIGLGAWCRGEDRLDAALRRADAALYRAKQGGRNRVEHAPASV